MALLTVEEALNWIPGVTDPDEDTEDAIEATIARADSILASELGYQAAVEGEAETLAATEYTRYLEGPGGRTLQLPFYPVIADDSGDVEVYDDPTEEFGASTQIDEADFELRPGGILLLGASSSAGSWSESEDPVILVTWTAGYDEDTIPGRLKEALGMMTGILWARRSSIGKSVVNTGRQTVTPRAPRTVPDEVLDLIAPYRLIGGLL